MICPGCDAWVPDDAGYCRGCGTIVRGPKVHQLRAPAPYVPPIAAGQAPAHPPPTGLAPPYPPPPPFAPQQPYGYGGTPYGAAYGGGRADTMWAGRGRARTAIRSSGGDFLVAVFAGLSLLSLFLPWYKLRLLDPFGESVSFAQTSALGSGAGGWRFAIVGSATLVLGYLGARLLLSRNWPLDVPHFPLLVLLALVNLALVVVAFFALPAGGVSITSQGYTFGVTQSWAAYVGLIAAILAVAAAISNRPKIARTA